MKERPILMSAPMVRAILAGTKTQTRRVVKVPPCSTHLRMSRGAEAPRGSAVAYFLEPGGEEAGSTTVRCPYGVPGDRLWVREAWHTDTSDLAYARAQHEDVMSSSPICYRADPVHHNAGCTWRPSIHMPRWASRITLAITDVRVERLQDISREDEIAEGTPPGMFYDALWDSINGAGSWADNPWVWVIHFRRIP